MDPHTPALIIVKVLTNNMGICKLLYNNILFIRIIKNTPAVTKVEEWTRADTGVGAAIASGSQTLNGSWALLVILPNIRRIIVDSLILQLVMFVDHEA